MVAALLAVIAAALAMVLQTWAQARIEPSRAAVVMAAEPVWAAAFAVLLGGERVTVRMALGGSRPRPRCTWSSWAAAGRAPAWA